MNARECCVCGSAATVTITPQVYTKTDDGKQLKMGKGVHVCESCLYSAPAATLGSALVRNATAGYNSIIGYSMQGAN